MPKISVLMPVYNTKEEYLREAIESILNQTYTDFEFIIINDGSTNNVESVIKSYDDDRIKDIYQKNQGAAAARNVALAEAKAEYIAIMDSDDISLPERLKKQIEYLEKNKEISIIGSWIKNFPNYKIWQTIKNPMYMDFLKSNQIAHPTVIWRKADFEKYNLKYDETYKAAHDYELWSRAIRYIKFANIQEVLLKYRWHEQNISHSMAEIQQKNAHQVQQNMLDYLTYDIGLQNNIKECVFNYSKDHFSFLENIFSIKNSIDNIHKIIAIFGIKIKIKRSSHA